MYEINRVRVIISNLVISQRLQIEWNVSKLSTYLGLWKRFAILNFLNITEFCSFIKTANKCLWVEIHRIIRKSILFLKKKCFKRNIGCKSEECLNGLLFLVNPFFYERIPSRNFQVDHSRDQTAYLKMSGLVEYRAVAFANTSNSFKVFLDKSALILFNIPINRSASEKSRING